MTSGTETPPLPRRRILVVDDSLSVQQSVLEAFAGVPHVEVHACGDVLAAEAILGRLTPDLVLCDVILPGRPGYDLCRQITRERKNGHPLVFLLSGAFEPFDEERATSAGADDVISKPFRPEEIRERLEGLLAPVAAVEPGQGTLASASTEDITAADLLPDLSAPDLPAAGAVTPPPGESSTEELVRLMLPVLVARMVKPVTELLLEQIQEPLAAQADEMLRREAESQVRRRLQELENEAGRGEQRPRSPQEDE
jgi:CheY-like chemotaxis protein